MIPLKKNREAMLTMDQICFKTWGDNALPGLETVFMQESLSERVGVRDCGSCQPAAYQATG
ncbi:MAG: hypothetical protein AVO38_13800 [delta proteobacterium ML8_D]|jgi:hypothetical protein|nr:MAG: hypothetical protein AVO38_13800 [delta proteobacterium ML8_D]